MISNRFPTFIYILSLFIGIILFQFFTVIKVNAEGTKEIMPNNTHISRLLFYPTFNPFASTGAGPDHRLHIHIENIGEKIYFGFGDIYNNFQTTVNDLSYLLIDPNGNTVINQTLIPSKGKNGYIKSYKEACNGPSIINPLGYIALSYTPTAIGDYYIEFNSSSYLGSGERREIDLFDITVTSSANTPIKGRVWSKEWLFTVPISHGASSYENPFYGQLYMYSKDSIVTTVDFNGIRPYVFCVTTNSTGTANTGDILNDRKSKYGNNTYPEYKMFLNDPDILSYPSGKATPYITPLGFSGCPGNYCINVYSSSSSYIELLFDLNGTSGYQEGTEDVLIIQNLSPGTSCIPWNGLNGLDQDVLPGTVIYLYYTMASGLTHMPLYDVEHNPEGFKINLVRPVTTSTKLKLYWDDSNFPNSTTPPIGGCVSNSGCHDFPLMFGDSRTINTWWYASSGIKDSLKLTFNGMVWDTIISNNPTCANTNDGILIAKILGGTPPFTYQLNKASIPNLNLNNLSAGFYTFSITDANNCKLSSSINLTAPPPIQATFLNSPDNCEMGIGSLITTIQSGNGPFSYKWSSGVNDTLDHILKKNKGTYTVTITDKNNCTFIFSDSILDIGVKLQTQDLVLHDTCGNGQGEIRILISNGADPLTYQWNTNPLMNVK